MAYAEGRLFVPVVDLCGWGSATSRQPLTSVVPSRGKGRLVALDAATGRALWVRRLPSPNFGCATVSNDVVFTSTFDGTAYAFAAGGRKARLAARGCGRGSTRVPRCSVISFCSAPEPHVPGALLLSSSRSACPDWARAR